MKATLKLIPIIFCLFMFNSAIADDMNMSTDDMELHHMHVLINHAMEMAAGGSNLVMLGQMNMADGIDETTVKHGKMMIEDAKSLIKEIMSGKEMMALHKKGETLKTSPEMAYTHKLAKAAQDYIDVLSSMPGMAGDEGMNMEHMDMHH
jgi:hypothetical protein